MPPRDFYDILGVSRTASEGDLRSAYRNLARQLHPDVNKAPDAQAKFTEVQEAYDVLSDPEKRRLYDRAGHAGVAAGAGRGPGAGEGGGSVHFDTGDMGDLGSMFDAFFGGNRPGGGSPFGAGATHAPRGARARRASPKPKLRRDLHVSFMTAVLGGRESVRVHTPSGSERTVEVRVPPGVEEGQVLRVRLGDPSEGELLLTVRVGKHPLFRRVPEHPRDLELTLPLTIGEGVFGATVTVPTPTGPVQLNIPPGTGSGRKLRLRERGVGAGKPSEKPGDLYAVVRLVAPKGEELTEAERETLRAIGARLPNPRAGDDWGGTRTPPA